MAYCKGLVPAGGFGAGSSGNLRGEELAAIGGGDGEDGGGERLERGDKLVSDGAGMLSSARGDTGVLCAGGVPSA